jgi:hypothetical protein
MYLRWLAVLILLAAQTAFGVALGVTKVGVASSTTTTATITWTTTGTTASADSRVAYSCAGGAIVNVVQGARVTSHSVTLTNIPAGALCTYTVSSQNATETATATAQTFRTCFPSAGKNTQTNATLYTFYAYGSYTLTWHDLSGIGGTPKQCGASITTPLSGTLDQNGNLSVAVPDVNQVTPSPGKWTFAFSSFAKTGAVSVDIAPTGGNYNATSTVQAAIALFKLYDWRCYYCCEILQYSVNVNGWNDWRVFFAG